jgi:hypothetical protein
VVTASPDDTAPAPTVPLGCFKHRRHDVSSYDAARIVASLTGALADKDDDDEEVCPLDALEWARDSEMYWEHVESRVMGSGAYVRDDWTGEVRRAAEAGR